MLEQMEWTQRYTDFLSGKDSRPARIVYQRDRARVIHSASFRRLQAKTQIFGLNESDFFRTRLTHSMEVAQIGSGLVEQLITVGTDESGREKEYVQWLPSMYLIEGICLAHDLGHPPYGHGGEVALNYMMRHYGGFEGNAQTLRILSKLGEYTRENGLDLSRRATLGVMKYPAVYEDVLSKHADYQKKLQSPETSDFRVLDFNSWLPPKSIYKEELPILEWALEPFNESDRTLFTRAIESDGGHSRTQYKALDTTIMELADDIAYGIHDLEDAVAMKMVGREIWQKEVMDSDELKRYPLWGDEMTERLFSNSSKGRKHAVSQMVGIMVEAIYMDENPNFSHPLLAYQARLEEGAMAVLELLKRFVFKNVITIAEVKQMEYKGQLIVLELFKSLRANPGALLPAKHFAKYQAQKTEQERQRVISDYIAGMTNTYASRLYAKLFTATQGSIFDML
ncbi:anti-phage deoxyguanosine triphosphatase [Thiomicrorhabdus sp. 6S3-12]|uniref:anti-phage deoxyguanosine triphosphatase n=1 Tax=Thiomicrorhabdus sp. 6S3-12 TaxID=2819681 RepID=UPI001AAC6068|nr:anti-phage deoxyguanosine triphosphatase [Thiomicrorhabdus sp. 6S3-12]MBO1924260.1 deoxyguanosinetriphosphate triphosphohydrolase family protein [Thiomicrorhabdus sp. 6S3-12]